MPPSMILTNTLGGYLCNPLYISNCTRRSLIKSLREVSMVSQNPATFFALSTFVWFWQKYCYNFFSGLYNQKFKKLSTFIPLVSNFDEPIHLKTLLNSYD
jgi:hypothetical protein